MLPEIWSLWTNFYKIRKLFAAHKLHEIEEEKIMLNSFKANACHDQRQLLSRSKNRNPHPKKNI